MTFLSHLINGISLGSVYAIIALGYTMVCVSRGKRSRKDHVCQLTDRDIGAIKGFDFL